jgi:phosphatidylinositol alpha-1,6-mannosyltransferase
MNPRIFFTYLTGFGFFGGIEKFNKAFIKALNQLFGENASFYALLDGQVEEKYFTNNADSWKTAKRNKIRFVLEFLRSAKTKDVIILGHLNLAILAVLLKKLFPKKRIILICHGIEIWQPNSWIQLKAYPLIDQFIVVSNHTKSQLIEKRGVTPSKVSVFQNTIDPFFDVPENLEKPAYLMDRYGLRGKKCILTVCRLSSKEGYKGYDRVLKVLPELVKWDRDIRYVLVGKYDAQEKERLDKIIQQLGIGEYVIFTSFVPDEELVDHFKLGDVFIMPSNNEGFGIVFIEAMACGVPVIAGNKDGSQDAVVQGRIGTLINPDSEQEICTSLKASLEKETGIEERLEIQQKVLSYFSYHCFLKRLKEIL